VSRQKALGVSERGTRPLQFAFTLKQRAEICQRDAYRRMVVPKCTHLDAQRPFVGLPGLGQLAQLFQDQRLVAQVDGDVGVIRSALPFAQRDSSLEKGPRRRQVVLVGQDVSQIGQVGRNGGIVRPIDRDALVENELKKSAGTFEIALLHERNGLLREIGHVVV